MNYMDQARKLRPILERAAVSLDDKSASEAAAFFPKLKQDGVLIAAGTRINWNGVIKKASADLWDSLENNPDNAPNLWQDLPYREGYRIIGQVLTVTTAFAKDEYGWWGDTLYRSLADHNVYTPAAYPGNWEQVES